jgi:hypothetical protein
MTAYVQTIVKIKSILVQPIFLSAIAKLRKIKKNEIRSYSLAHCYNILAAPFGGFEFCEFEEQFLNLNLFCLVKLKKEDFMD